MDAIQSVDWFYLLAHQEIWQALATLNARGFAPDLITLSNELRDRGKLEAVGGLAYLAALQNDLPSAVNLPHYLEIMREKAQLRALLQVCAAAVSDIYTDGVESPKIIERAQAGILLVTEEAASERETSMRQIVPGVIDTLEEFSQGNKVMAGYSSGFNYLDNMTSGFEKAQMYVIAGRPSTGKTSLVMDFVLNFSILHGPIAFFSMEMNKQQIGMRALANRARVDFQKFRNGFLTEGDAPRLIASAGELAGLPIHVDDTCGLNGQQILLRARRMVRQHGIKAIAIDYLQLIHGVERYREKRDRVADASEWCKRIAKSLNMPVIVLAQLNRESEKSGHRRPMLSDLAESGDIEQDADLVASLYRPKLNLDVLNPARATLRQAKEQFAHMDDYNKREWYWLRRLDTGDPADLDKPLAESVAFIELAVLKQRNGPTGDAGLVFYKRQMRFVDAWKGNNALRLESDPADAGAQPELEEP
jgi:replicative DNA helicase